LGFGKECWFSGFVQMRFHIFWMVCSIIDQLKTNTTSDNLSML
jgi:hypothetical protein